MQTRQKRSQTEKTRPAAGDREKPERGAHNEIPYLTTDEAGHPKPGHGERHDQPGPEEPAQEREASDPG